MKLFVWALSGGAAVAALTLVVACVGDDPQTSSDTKPDPNVAAGELRGRCKDGRCLSGLYCDPVNDICLVGNGGSITTDGGSDGSSTDGAVTIPCPVGGLSTSELACPGADRDGGCEKCCVGSSANTCRSTVELCSSGDKTLTCTSRGTCPATGDVTCCLAASKPLSGSDSCPSTLSHAELTKTRCGPQCPIGEYVVCAGDSECEFPAKCRRVALQLGGFGFDLGICQ